MLPQSYTEHSRHSWLLAAIDLPSVPGVLPFWESSVNGITYVAFCDWLILLLKFICIFKCAYLIYENSICSTVLTILDIISLFNFSHSSRYTCSGIPL